MIVLPTWQDQLAVRDKDGASGLWSLARTPTETSAETARRAMRAVSCVSGHQPLMTCVASVGGVDYWCADYDDVVHQMGTDVRIAVLMDSTVFVTCT